MYGQLLSNLQADEQHALELQALLLREQDALKDRQLEALQDQLASKQSLLKQLEEGSHARSQLLQSQGLPASLNSLKQLAKNAPQGDALIALACRVDELLHTCRAINEVNGRLMRANQNSISQLLGILRGQDTPLYNRYGNNAGIARNRPLSSA